jgi:hypothetical protein
MTTNGMGRAMRRLAVAGWVLGAAAVQAASADPGPAQCLKQGDGEGLKLSARDAHVHALVRVQLRFEAADAPPAVDLLFSNGDEAVNERVRAHVATYRLPCWTPAEGPVRFVQEFSLRGSSRPAYLEPRPTPRLPSGGGARELPVPGGACIVKAPAMGFPDNVALPDHPVNVVALFHFVPGQDEPVVEMKSFMAHRTVVRTVEREIKRYRMVCTGAPFTERMQQSVKVTPEGLGDTGFVNKPLSLAQWVRAAKEPARGEPYFDFHTMACPFSVEITYQQPLLENAVKSVGEPNPNRQLFLDWLKTTTLNVPPINQELLHGARTLIDVPCGVLDLR